jgi:hypothetical protein
VTGPGRSRPVTGVRVLALAALLVAGVLAVDVMSALFPPLDSFLAGTPAVALGLVAVTAVVLILVARRRDASD